MHAHDITCIHVCVHMCVYFLFACFSLLASLINWKQCCDSGGFFLACKDLGGRFDDSFLPVLLLFLSGDQLTHTSSLLSPESVHSGSANWDDCGQVFSDELYVSSFPFLVQNQSTVVQQTEMTVAKCFLISCMWAHFPHRFPHSRHHSQPTLTSLGQGGIHILV